MPNDIPGETWRHPVSANRRAFHLAGLIGNDPNESNLQRRHLGMVPCSNLQETHEYKYPTVKLVFCVSLSLWSVKFFLCLLWRLFVPIYPHNYNWQQNLVSPKWKWKQQCNFMQKSNRALTSTNLVSGYMLSTFQIYILVYDTLRHCDLPSLTVPWQLSIDALKAAWQLLEFPETQLFLDDYLYKIISLMTVQR